MTQAILIAMRGLPGSGKTTAALSWVADDPESRVRVGRDPLRDALYGTRKGLTFAQENYLTKVEHGLIREALKAGKNVVVDDPNLKLKYVREIATIAEGLGARFEVLDVTTPVDECVRRDAKRVNRVGEKAIRGLHKRYPERPHVTPLAPKGEASHLNVRKYEPDTEKPMAWIFDIDGTLALNKSGRGWYDTTRVGEDSPNGSIVQLAQDLSELGYDILVCSGRSDACEIVTADWLTEHLGHDRWDELFMRKNGDNRANDIVKLEIFDQHIRDNWNVLGVVDDSNSVVAMWRELGLTCLQCAPGDF